MKPWLFLSVALFFVSLSAGAVQVYQWLDAEGNLHFSQTPPPEDVGATQREVRPPATSIPDAVDAEKDKSDAPLGEDAEKVLKDLSPTQLRAYNCQQAKAYLARVQQAIQAASAPAAPAKPKNDNPAVAQTSDTPDNKTPPPPPPKQGKADLESAQKSVDQYCAPPTP